MDRHDFDIPITFKHRVIFTRDAFASGNETISQVLEEGGGRRVLVFVEEAVAAAWKGLSDQVHTYFGNLDFDFRGLQIFHGGEECKGDEGLVRDIWKAIDDCRIDRHSYVIAIGGGAFLDAVGFAVSTAHRGVRLLRLPTTTLSQDDSGVGVKSAINAFGKKNWIGSFSVPFAVINDFKLLESQDPKTSVAGLIEAIKVALVKDGDFFEWIEEHLVELASLEKDALEECVKRSALLHASHIAMGGDPFETGSSRPLDFGHWAAHKMEALTNYQLSHAEAVAVGLALDTTYSCKKGFLGAVEARRVLEVLSGLGLKTYHPALDWMDDNGERRVLAGLNEFREHLGGELTVLLLQDLGKGIDVHEFDMGLLDQSIEELRETWEAVAV